jgi:hypothetical protein
MNDTVAKARRRAKIAAIAKTADYNPEEAAVAQAMLEKSPEGTLERIATDIKVEWGKGIESQFAIGHMLSEAYNLLSGGDKQAFGRWFRAQNFQFDQPYAYRLRIAAERESDVRAYLAANADHAQLHGRRPIESITTVIQQWAAKPKPPVADVGPTVPVDPAFAALREAHRLIVDGDAFLTMHIDDLHASAGFIKELVAAYQEAKARR